MDTENTIIIFHRSKQSAEESLANQQNFLKKYNNNLTRAEYVIQYDIYYLLNSLKILVRAELYLMDSEGKLYKQIKDITSF